MPDFQTQVLDAIARVVGGTADPTDPSFFSGAKANGGAGDGTGVSGLVGCYATPPRSVDATPLGIVITDRFKLDLFTQGEIEEEDFVRLLILIAPYEGEWQTRLLTPYRDSVPAAFFAHMQAFNTPTPPAAMDFVPTDGQGGTTEWGGIPYLSFEFTVRVRRTSSVTYVP